MKISSIAFVACSLGAYFYYQDKISTDSQQSIAEVEQQSEDKLARLLLEKKNNWNEQKKVNAQLASIKAQQTAQMDKNQEIHSLQSDIVGNQSNDMGTLKDQRSTIEKELARLKQSLANTDSKLKNITNNLESKAQEEIAKINQDLKFTINNLNSDLQSALNVRGLTGASGEAKKEQLREAHGQKCRQLTIAAQNKIASVNNKTEEEILTNRQQAESLKLKLNSKIDQQLAKMRAVSGDIQSEANSLQNKENQVSTRDNSLLTKNGYTKKLAELTGKQSELTTQYAQLNKHIAQIKQNNEQTRLSVGEKQKENKKTLTITCSISAFLFGMIFLSTLRREK